MANAAYLNIDCGKRHFGRCEFIQCDLSHQDAWTATASPICGNLYCCSLALAVLKPMAAFLEPVHCLVMGQREYHLFASTIVLCCRMLSTGSAEISTRETPFQRQGLTESQPCIQGSIREGNTKSASPGRRRGCGGRSSELALGQAAVDEPPGVGQRVVDAECLAVALDGGKGGAEAAAVHGQEQGQQAHAQFDGLGIFQRDGKRRGQGEQLALRQMQGRRCRCL